MFRRERRRVSSGSTETASDIELEISKIDAIIERIRREVRSAAVEVDSTSTSCQSSQIHADLSTPAIPIAEATILPIVSQEVLPTAPSSTVVEEPAANDVDSTEFDAEIEYSEDEFIATETAVTQSPPSSHRPELTQSQSAGQSVEILNSCVDLADQAAINSDNHSVAPPEPAVELPHSASSFISIMEYSPSLASRETSTDPAPVLSVRADIAMSESDLLSSTHSRSEHQDDQPREPPSAIPFAPILSTAKIISQFGSVFYKVVDFDNGVYFTDIHGKRTEFFLNRCVNRPLKNHYGNGKTAFYVHRLPEEALKAPTQLKSTISQHARALLRVKIGGKGRIHHTGAIEVERIVPIQVVMQLASPLQLLAASLGESNDALPFSQFSSSALRKSFDSKRSESPTMSFVRSNSSVRLSAIPSSPAIVAAEKEVLQSAADLLAAEQNAARLARSFRSSGLAQSLMSSGIVSRPTSPQRMSNLARPRSRRAKSPLTHSAFCPSHENVSTLPSNLPVSASEGQAGQSVVDQVEKSNVELTVTEELAPIEPVPPTDDADRSLSASALASESVMLPVQVEDGSDNLALSGSPVQLPSTSKQLQADNTNLAAALLAELLSRRDFSLLLPSLLATTDSSQRLAAIQQWTATCIASEPVVDATTTAVEQVPLLPSESQLNTPSVDSVDQKCQSEIAPDVDVIRSTEEEFVVTVDEHVESSDALTSVEIQPAESATVIEPKIEAAVTDVVSSATTEALLPHISESKTVAIEPTLIAKPATVAKASVARPVSAPKSVSYKSQKSELGSTKVANAPVAKAPIQSQKILPVAVAKPAPKPIVPSRKPSAAPATLGKPVPVKPTTNAPRSSSATQARAPPAINKSIPKATPVVPIKQVAPRPKPLPSKPLRAQPLPKPRVTMSSKVRSSPLHRTRTAPAGLSAAASLVASYSNRSIAWSPISDLSSGSSVGTDSDSDDQVQLNFGTAEDAPLLVSTESVGSLSRTHSHVWTGNRLSVSSSMPVIQARPMPELSKSASAVRAIVPPLLLPGLESSTGSAVQTSGLVLQTIQPSHTFAPLSMTSPAASPTLCQSPVIQARGSVAGLLPVPDRTTIVSHLLLSPSFGGGVDDTMVAKWSNQRVAEAGANAAALAVMSITGPATAPVGASMSARPLMNDVTVLIPGAMSAR